MINIKIACVGNVKEKYFRDALEEYYKRLTRYVNFKVVEVKEESVPKGASAAEIEKIKDTESDRLLAQCDGYVILLTPTGKSFSSPDFAKHLKKLEDSFSSITFIIGGSYGVNQKVIDKANLCIKFGDFTYPHQLFRVMLSEQIYRAYTIINNVTYHKWLIWKKKVLWSRQ